MTLFILLALAATDVSPVDPSRPGKTPWGSFTDGGVALRTVQEAGGASTAITGQVSVNIVDAGSPINVQGTFWQATQPVSGTFWQATQPVSGTVTTTPPSNASTNVAQFGGTNISTGTGVGGAGIPRVTVSSDTVLACTESGTWTVQPGNTANTTPWLATARVVGNTGAVVDAANNAAAPANVLVPGFEVATQGATQPTAATAGNVRRALADGAGALFVHPHGPVSWSCFVQAVTVMTQCRAAPAAGIRAYVNTVVCDNQAATVQTVDVVFGTGANCATAPTAITHKFQMGTNATTTSPDHVTAYFPAPLVPTAANAICVRPLNATAFGCTLTGYDAQ